MEPVEIKDEPSDVIDLDAEFPKTPEEIVYDWNQTVIKNFNQQIVSEDKDAIYDKIQWYLNELKMEVSDFEDLETSAFVMMKHIKCLANLYKRSNSIFSERYLNMMEEILVIYVNIIIRYITNKRKKVKNREIKKIITHDCRKIKCLLPQCLMEQMDRVFHVLMKIDVDPTSQSCRDILTNVYGYFLTRLPQKTSDENFLRGYIIFQKWKQIRKPDEHETMDKCMYTLYKKQPEQLQTNELFKKILMPSIRVDSLTLEVDQSDSIRMLMQNYFDYVKTQLTSDDDEAFVADGLEHLEIEEVAHHSHRTYRSDQEGFDPNINTWLSELASASEKNTSHSPLISVKEEPPEDDVEFVTANKWRIGDYVKEIFDDEEVTEMVIRKNSNMPLPMSEPTTSTRRERRSFLDSIDCQSTSKSFSNYQPTSTSNLSLRTDNSYTNNDRNHTITKGMLQTRNTSAFILVCSDDELDSPSESAKSTTNNDNVCDIKDSLQSPKSLVPMYDSDTEDTSTTENACDKKRDRMSLNVILPCRNTAAPVSPHNLLNYPSPKSPDTKTSFSLNSNKNANSSDLSIEIDSPSIDTTTSIVNSDLTGVTDDNMSPKLQSSNSVFHKEGFTLSPQSSTSPTGVNKGCLESSDTPESWVHKFETFLYSDVRSDALIASPSFSGNSLENTPNQCITVTTVENVTENVSSCSAHKDLSMEITEPKKDEVLNEVADCVESSISSKEYPTISMMNHLDLQTPSISQVENSESILKVSSSNTTRNINDNDDNFSSESNVNRKLDSEVFMKTNKSVNMDTEIVSNGMCNSTSINRKIGLNEAGLCESSSISVPLNLGIIKSTDASDNGLENLGGVNMLHNVKLPGENTEHELVPSVTEDNMSDTVEKRKNEDVALLTNKIVVEVSNLKLNKTSSDQISDCNLEDNKMVQTEDIVPSEDKGGTNIAAEKLTLGTNVSGANYGVQNAVNSVFYTPESQYDPPSDMEFGCEEEEFSGSNKNIADFDREHPNSYEYGYKFSESDSKSDKCSINDPKTVSHTKNSSVNSDIEKNINSLNDANETINANDGCSESSVSASTKVATTKQNFFSIDNLSISSANIEPVKTTNTFEPAVSISNNILKTDTQKNVATEDLEKENQIKSSKKAALNNSVKFSSDVNEVGNTESLSVNNNKLNNDQHDSDNSVTNSFDSNQLPNILKSSSESISESVTPSVGYDMQMESENDLGDEFIECEGTNLRDVDKENDKQLFNEDVPHWKVKDNDDLEQILSGPFSKPNNNIISPDEDFDLFENLADKPPKSTLLNGTSIHLTHPRLNSPAPSRVQPIKPILSNSKSKNDQKATSNFNRRHVKGNRQKERRYSDEILSPEFEPLEDFLHKDLSDNDSNDNCNIKRLDNSSPCSDSSEIISSKCATKGHNGAKNIGPLDFIPDNGADKVTPSEVERAFDELISNDRERANLSLKPNEHLLKPRKSSNNNKSKGAFDTSKIKCDSGRENSLKRKLTELIPGVSADAKRVKTNNYRNETSIPNGSIAEKYGTTSQKVKHRIRFNETVEYQESGDPKVKISKLKDGDSPSRRQSSPYMLMVDYHKNSRQKNTSPERPPTAITRRSSQPNKLEPFRKMLVHNQKGMLRIGYSSADLSPPTTPPRELSSPSMIKIGSRRDKASPTRVKSSSHRASRGSNFVKSPPLSPLQRTTLKVSIKLEHIRPDVLRSLGFQCDTAFESNSNESEVKYQDLSDEPDDNYVFHNSPVNDNNSNSSNTVLTSIADDENIFKTHGSCKDYFESFSVSPDLGLHSETQESICESATLNEIMTPEGIDGCGQYKDSPTDKCELVKINAESGDIKKLPANNHFTCNYIPIDSDKTNNFYQNHNKNGKLDAERISKYPDLESQTENPDSICESATLNEIMTPEEIDVCGVQYHDSKADECESLIIDVESGDIDKVPANNRFTCNYIPIDTEKTSNFYQTHIMNEKLNSEGISKYPDVESQSGNPESISETTILNERMTPEEIDVCGLQYQDSRTDECKAVILDIEPCIDKIPAKNHFACDYIPIDSNKTNNFYQNHNMNEKLDIETISEYPGVESHSGNPQSESTTLNGRMTPEEIDVCGIQYEDSRKCESVMLGVNSGDIQNVPANNRYNCDYIPINSETTNNFYQNRIMNKKLAAETISKYPDVASHSENRRTICEPATLNRRMTHEEIDCCGIQYKNSPKDEREPVLFDVEPANNNFSSHSETVSNYQHNILKYQGENVIVRRNSEVYEDQIDTESVCFIPPTRNLESNNCNVLSVPPNTNETGYQPEGIYRYTDGRGETKIINLPLKARVKRRNRANEKSSLILEGIENINNCRISTEKINNHIHQYNTSPAHLSSIPDPVITKIPTVQPNVVPQSHIVQIPSSEHQFDSYNSQDSQQIFPPAPHAHQNYLNQRIPLVNWHLPSNTVVDNVHNGLKLDQPYNAIYTSPAIPKYVRNPLYYREKEPSQMCYPHTEPGGPPDSYSNVQELPNPTLLKYNNIQEDSNSTLQKFNEILEPANLTLQNGVGDKPVMPVKRGRGRPRKQKKCYVKK